MARGYLAQPGTEHGPCVDCTHVDCAESRRMAASTCRFCGKPIGYDTDFYADPEMKTVTPQPLVHALCLELEVEQRR